MNPLDIKVKPFILDIEGQTIELRSWTVKQRLDFALHAGNEDRDFGVEAIMLSCPSLTREQINDMDCNVAGEIVKASLIFNRLSKNDDAKKN